MRNSEADPKANPVGEQPKPKKVLFFRTDVDSAAYQAAALALMMARQPMDGADSSERIYYYQADEGKAILKFGDVCNDLRIEAAYKIFVLQSEAYDKFVALPDRGRYEGILLDYDTNPNACAAVAAEEKRA